MLWTNKVTGGPRRVNHAAVGVPKKRLVFTFGGYCTGEEYNQILKMDVHIFNACSLQWYAMKTPSRLNSNQYCCVPYMRYGHTASLVGSKAYIFGGRSDRNGACNVLYCFDTDMFTWSIPSTDGIPPEARDGHSACVIKTKIYICGGFKEIDQRFSSDLHMLETETMTWHRPFQTTLCIWRDFHTSTAIGNKIYVFGGRGDRNGPIHTNEDIYDNAVYEFDTEKLKWTVLSVSGNVPHGRRSHSAIAYNDNIYIFGGYNGQLNKHFADLWKFNPVNKQWTEVKTKGDGPCARRRHSWSLLDNEVVLFGGTCPSAIPKQVDVQDEDELANLKDLSDVYILDLSPSLTTLCKKAVLAYNVDCSELPLQIRGELESMRHNSCEQKFSTGMTQG
ncbi:kelch domain-containing protein 3-like [Rhopilema esculentum]|uniref:kelch domain-containing protein 3-like n=1 Tax=Rhopilema esculentum TaxID=499914 RepID=UPI0031E0CC03|eukprot:gene13336-4184_t